MSAPFHVEHADAQDDVVVIGCYDVGIGPAVVFGGGGFSDSATLRAFAADLLRGAEWLEEEAA